MTALHHRLRSLAVAALACWSLSAGSAPAAEEMPPGVIELDETVISGNQELPKVLYIVPWQQPDGMPDFRIDAGQAEADLFRRLYPPAHRRELEYLEAWQPDGASNVAKE